MTMAQQFRKLDYSLKTAAERTQFVQDLIAEVGEKALIKNKTYLEALSNYIVTAMTPEEKKEKKILTDNRMVTVNKRETSYQGLVAKFENGEDGIYNLIIDNDKNVKLTHKLEITKQDLEDIQPLQDLRDSIAAVEKMQANATGKNKFLLKKQLIEMHQEQYIIKSEYKKQIGATPNTIKSFAQLDLSEHITINEDGDPESDGLVSLLNPKHVSALLCNYSALKEDV